MSSSSSDEENTQKLRKSSKKESSSESESENEQTGEIRCICKDNTDHGLMIQCEKCLVWQHSICVGIRGDKSVPKHYFCEICAPRTFKCLCNKNDAVGKVIQCSQCSTWQHIRCLGKSTRALPKPYKCPSCDPTVLENSLHAGKPKKKRKNSSEFDFISSKRLREEMEEDYFLIFTRNLTKPKTSKDFRTVYLSYRGLLEKYFVKLMDDSSDEKYNATELIKGVSVILECEPDIVQKSFEELVKFVEQTPTNHTNGTISAEKTPDLKGFSIIKDNIYTSKVKRPPLPKPEISSCSVENAQTSVSTTHSTESSTDVNANLTSNDSTTTTTTTNTTTTTENNSNSTQIEPKTDETEAEKNKQTDGEKNKDDNKVMEITSTDTGSAKESSDVATTPSIINKSLCTSDRCFCRMNHYECGLNCLCGCPKDDCQNRQIQGGKFLPFNVQKVANNTKWGITMATNVDANQLITEYVGSVTEMEQLDYRNLSQEERTFILALNDMDLCIDARKYGSNARYVRRSCKPNAEAKELFVNNQLRVGIFAKQQIAADEEVTIGFDYPWKESACRNHCACGQIDCIVSAWHDHLKTATKKALAEIQAVDLTPSEPIEQVAKKRRIEPTSPTEETRDQDKLSREERKIALLMKSIQKMESRQNRKRKHRGDKEGPSKRERKDDESSESNSSVSTPQQMDIQSDQSPPSIVSTPSETKVELKTEDSVSTATITTSLTPKTDTKPSSALSVKKAEQPKEPKPKKPAEKDKDKDKDKVSSDAQVPLKRKGPGRPPKYPRPATTTIASTSTATPTTTPSTTTSAPAVPSSTASTPSTAQTAPSSGNASQSANSVSSTTTSTTPATTGTSVVKRPGPGRPPLKKKPEGGATVTKKEVADKTEKSSEKSSKVDKSSDKSADRSMMSETKPLTLQRKKEPSGQTTVTHKSTAIPTNAPKIPEKKPIPTLSKPPLGMLDKPTTNAGLPKSPVIPRTATAPQKLPTKTVTSPPTSPTLKSPKVISTATVQQSHDSVQDKPQQRDLPSSSHSSVSVTNVNANPSSETPRPKMGKKAWILDYSIQTQQASQTSQASQTPTQPPSTSTQTTSTAPTTSTPSESHKLPLKKKMLDSYKTQTTTSTTESIQTESILTTSDSSSNSAKATLPITETLPPTTDVVNTNATTSQSRAEDSMDIDDDVRQNNILYVSGASPQPQSVNGSAKSPSFPLPPSSFPPTSLVASNGKPPDSHQIPSHVL